MSIPYNKDCPIHCDICGGRCKNPCLICGHYRSREDDERTRDSWREQIDFLLQANQGLLKFGNTSTRDVVFDDKIALFREWMEKVKELAKHGSLNTLMQDLELTKMVLVRIIKCEIIRAERDIPLHPEEPRFHPKGSEPKPKPRPKFGIDMLQERVAPETDLSREF